MNGFFKLASKVVDCRISYFIVLGTSVIYSTMAFIKNDVQRSVCQWKVIYRSLHPAKSYIAISGPKKSYIAISAVGKHGPPFS